MKKYMGWRACLVGPMTLLALTPALAIAAGGYPTKPIQLIAPMAPGGGIDILARYVGQKLSERLGQPVVVENRPGANGNIGAASVRRAPADGYTLLMTYVGTQAINPGLYKNLNFDPANDFVAVAPLAATPYVLVAHSSVPVKTMDDVVKYAKANPGKLNYGSAGMGSVGHLAGKIFEQQTGTSLTYVAYKGTAPSLIDLRSGQIQLMFNTLGSLRKYFADGQIRPIILAAKKRATGYSDIPTSVEVGYGDFQVSTWYGIVAPKGTPKEVVDRLNREINNVLNEPEVQRFFAQEDYQAMHMSADDFAAFIRSEQVRWRAIITNAKVTLE